MASPALDHLRTQDSAISPRKSKYKCWHYTVQGMPKTRVWNFDNIWKQQKHDSSILGLLPLKGLYEGRNKLVRDVMLKCNALILTRQWQHITGKNLWNNGLDSDILLSFLFFRLYDPFNGKPYCFLLVDSLKIIHVKN